MALFLVAFLFCFYEWNLSLQFAVGTVDGEEPCCAWHVKLLSDHLLNFQWLPKLVY